MSETELREIADRLRVIRKMPTMDVPSRLDAVIADILASIPAEPERLDPEGINDATSNEGSRKQADEGLDVERLARALWNLEVPAAVRAMNAPGMYGRESAAAIAAEYARLAPARDDTSGGAS